MKPLISVVILNWDGIDDTLRCIDSLLELDYDNYEVIVVDNGSKEDISKLRELNNKSIKLIENKTNRGFTGGEITGLEHSNGDYILILNNDAIIEKSAITEALKVFDKDPKIAAVGGRSYLLDDHGGKMGIFHYTHQRVDPVTAEVSTYSKDDGTERDVSNISGACVLIKRSVIEELGYFDNSFFAYYEETDLFSRFRRAGYRIVFSPKVVIWHKMGASTRSKKYMYSYLNLKNQFYFAYKNFDKSYLKLFMKAYRRHFRRSLMIVAKNFGRVAKHDVIHKARVDAYINTLISRISLRARRRETLAINPSFSINEVLFRDNPLPISLFIDATMISSKQTKVLYSNLQAINNLSIKPAEIIVVSKKDIKLPETESIVRFANIVDKGYSNLSPLDYFFMTSNYDLLLFCKVSEFLNQVLSSESLKLLEKSIQDIYTNIETNETVAALSSDHNMTVTPGFIRNTPYEVIALSKQTLVNHLSDDMFISSITNDVITDTVGRSVAQCINVQTLSKNHFFGISHGSLSDKYEPILFQPIQWRIKYTLTKAHLWRLTSMIIRRLKFNNTHLGATSDNSSSTSLSISKDIPIIFNTRDRFDPLEKMVKWLNEQGYTNLIFVDNDSSYPPLMDFFNTSPYQVIKLGRNAMHKAPWESMAVRFFAKDQPYIVSDPDIVPDDQCPPDMIEYLASLLNAHPKPLKAGLGLRIDNLPDSNRQKADIISWEQRFWDPSAEIAPDVYEAEVDTTFALYRPYTWWCLSPSLRTGGDYVALHEPWYQSSDEPSEDFLYYKMRASREVSTWGMDSLPKHHMRALKKEGFIDEVIDEEDE